MGPERAQDPNAGGPTTETERPDREDTVEDADELRARLRLLELENSRLRSERDRANRVRYRRGALALLSLGIVSALAGLVLTESRTVLFSLAGVGLFSSVLTYFLTAKQFVSVSTIERVYLAHAETLAEIVGELGLHDTAVYVPSENDVPGLSSVRLFVPQQATFELPADLSSVFVVSEDGRRRGVAVHSVGSALFAEFHDSLRDPLAETPDGLADQLAAALVEDFELVATADPAYDPENEHVTFLVEESALGAIDRFDHPVPSFVASGLARGLDRPVGVEVHKRDDGRFLVVCAVGDDATSGSVSATHG